MTALQLKRQTVEEFRAVCHEIRSALGAGSISSAQAELRLAVLTRIVIRYRLLYDDLMADARRWGYVDKQARLTNERRDIEETFERVKDLVRWYKDGGDMCMTTGSPIGSDYGGAQGSEEDEPKPGMMERSKMLPKTKADDIDREDEIEKLQAELHSLKIAHNKLKEELREKKDNEPPPPYGDTLRHQVTFNPKVFSTPMVPISAEAVYRKEKEKDKLANFPAYPWEEQIAGHTSQTDVKVKNDKEDFLSPYMLESSFDVYRAQAKDPCTEGLSTTNPFSPNYIPIPPLNAGFSERWEMGPRRNEGQNVTTNPLLPGVGGPSRNLGQTGYGYNPDDSVKYLTKIPLAKFRGDKKMYPGWWSAFSACVDQTSLDPKVKMLKMLDCLENEPRRIVEELGISDQAYEVAKDRLRRKYGGSRRQLTLACDDVNSFRQIRDGVAGDLEKLVELLDRLVVRLTDQGEAGELGSGFLYNGIQKKLTPTFLARYHRWLYDNGHQGTVLTLRTFVDQESEFLTSASESVTGFHYQERKRKDRSDARTSFTQQSTAGSEGARPRECRVCKKPHGVWECVVFKKLSPSERNKKVKELRLCYKCLGTHPIDKCWRKRPCTKPGCGKPHHVLLHDDSRAGRSSTGAGNAPPPPIPPRVNNDNTVGAGTTNLTLSGGQPPVSSADSDTTSVTTSSDKDRTNLTASESNTEYFVSFRTVPVILENQGRKIRVNALLDDASNRSYISKTAAHALDLVGIQTKVTVQAVTTEITEVDSEEVTCILKSENGKICQFFTAKTLPSISDGLIVQNLNVKARKWEHLKHIKFPKPAGKSVDLLIGLDYMCLMTAGRNGDICGQPGEPIARETPLGWTCVSACGQTGCYHTCITVDLSNQAKLLKAVNRFWELEEIPKAQAMNYEDQQALKMVKESVTKIEGRFCVGQPWKAGRPDDINNYLAALKRLKSTENKLLRNPDEAKAYQEVFDLYKKEGYIRKIIIADILKNLGWYLPHFPVIREGAATTKTRPVYDASAKYKGICLNDLIYQGPKLQKDLVEIIIRFRRFMVAISCDIARMYLQVLMKELDQCFQRFLWRDLDQSREPDVYQFTRVVFGVNSSPFLAQFVAQMNAREFLDRYPEAARMILDSTYMDDLWDSVHDDDTGIRIVREVKEIWNAAKMTPHKWMSNSTAVLNTIPEEERGVSVDLAKHELPRTKVLGCGWDPEKDFLVFVSSFLHESTPETKREFLSVLSTIFDPLGLVSPVVIQGKIIMQRCWYEGEDWDKKLPDNLLRDINLWINGLKKLDLVQVPRVLIPGTDYDVTLHVFGDASGIAYGAVVFSVAVNPKREVYINIVASKSRVAPLTAVSIPRLELEAAVLSTRLMSKVAAVLEVGEGLRYYWTDSMDVLYWVHSRSRDHKPFVAHRIGEIQKESSPQAWDHVPTKLNPADVVSRGLDAETLVDCQLWWKGPPFLELTKDQWPSANLPSELPTKERRKNITLFARAEENRNRILGAPNFDGTKLDPLRWSDLHRLLRVMVYVIRAVDIMQKSESKRGGIMGTEIQEAQTLLILDAQAQYFPGDVKSLAAAGVNKPGSVIYFLKPWLDEHGVLRASSRLTQSQAVPWETKYPIILPKNAGITRLLVMNIHQELGHAGTNGVLAEFLKLYFTLGVRDVINSVITSCYSCKRWRAKHVQPAMAPLPEDRLVRIERPFTRVSLDFAGPFPTKAGRGKPRNKRYLCVYVCMLTRAVHLEIVSDMTTQCFLLALSRIIARRGRPKIVWSDNGSNFIGGKEELARLREVISPGELETLTSRYQIDWKFNPPGAPHFNGLHEVMVRSAKRALYKILPTADITDEELSTATCETERILNNRPLTYQSADPRDNTVLTPNHFILGSMGLPLLTEKPGSWSKEYQYRWRYIQGVIEDVWKRWMEEWVTSLSARPKWLKDQRNLRVDDVVLLADNQVPRGKWRIGRVNQVFPGQDGIVRVVEVETAGKLVKRPAVKACLLVEKL